MLLTLSMNKLKVRKKFHLFVLRTQRYFLVGYLLHLMTLAGVFLTVVFSYLAQEAMKDQQWWMLSLYVYLALYGFSLPFFSQLDARSRYQNYKLMKDKLFEYGFNTRIIAPFTSSRCQRDAISVAAHDLGMGESMNEYLKKMGFRWYHILPRLVLQRPGVLFTRSYWSITLFTRTYVMKHFDY